MFNKILPMTGVEPRTSGLESDSSTNCATTTSRCQNSYEYFRVRSLRIVYTSGLAYAISR